MVQNGIPQMTNSNMQYTLIRPGINIYKWLHLCIVYSRWTIWNKSNISQSNIRYLWRLFARALWTLRQRIQWYTARLHMVHSGICLYTIFIFILLSPFCILLCHLYSGHCWKPRLSPVYTHCKTLRSQGPDKRACGMTLHGLFERKSSIIAWWAPSHYPHVWFSSVGQLGAFREMSHPQMTCFCKAVYNRSTFCWSKYVCVYCNKVRPDGHNISYYRHLEQQDLILAHLLCIFSLVRKFEIYCGGAVNKHIYWS